MGERRGEERGDRGQTMIPPCFIVSSSGCSASKSYNAFTCCFAGAGAATGAAYTV